MTFAQTSISFDFIWDNMGIFLDGVRLTIFISIVAFTLATIGGLAVALMRMSKSRIVRMLIAAYINVFRAIPLLVFILFVYYGIAISFELQVSAIQAGILALTLQYSAWLGEIFRGGIQAVSHGQREAALSIGMSRFQAFLRVVLPQAFRIAIPPTGNMFIGMIKDSSLVYLIGVPELLRVSNRLANRTFRYFEVYLATVLIYLILTTSIYFLVKYLEQRYALIDVLTAKGRRFSLFGGRKAARLRQLQEKVAEHVIAAPLEMEMHEEFEEDAAEGSAETTSARPAPDRDVGDGP
jgi:His/Glu/Gln/Arg/opine family amino acid ABC transporter permease subunit